MSGKPEDYRAKAREASRFLQEDENIPGEIGMFFLELVENFLSIDQRTAARRATMMEKILASQRIADETKEFLAYILESHDADDASTRMQTRTLLGEALIGKPPEATQKWSGTARTLPGGAVVPSPRAADLMGP